MSGNGTYWFFQQHQGPASVSASPCCRISLKGSSPWRLRRRGRRRQEIDTGLRVGGSGGADGSQQLLLQQCGGGAVAGSSPGIVKGCRWRARAAQSQPGDQRHLLSLSGASVVHTSRRVVAIIWFGDGDMNGQRSTAARGLGLTAASVVRMRRRASTKRRQTETTHRQPTGQQLEVSLGIGWWVGSVGLVALLLQLLLSVGRRWCLISISPDGARRRPRWRPQSFARLSPPAPPPPPPSSDPFLTRSCSFISQVALALLYLFTTLRYT